MSRNPHLHINSLALRQRPGRLDRRLTARGRPVSSATGRSNPYAFGRHLSQWFIWAIAA